MIDRAMAAKAAAFIGAARFAGRAADAIPEDCRPRSEADGYAIQAALHEWLHDAGQGRRLGFKIGCTTPVMQKLLGINTPAYGGILAANCHADGQHFPASRFRRLGIECEIAVRMGADLAPGGAPYGREDVAGAVAECMAAMEIVDDRYGAYRPSDVPLLIADDFFHTACILGPARRDWRGIDLAAAGCRTNIDGAEAAAAVGAHVMGHPFEALAWLANKLAAQGRTLAAGQLVLTGSVPAVQWIKGGAAVISVDGLGEVGATFA